MRPHAKSAASARALLETGIAESHRGEFAALRTLAIARDACGAAGDRPGETLSAAAWLVTGHSMNIYKGFAKNAEILTRFHEGALAFVDSNDELLAHAGLMCALLFLRPTDPYLERGVDRILELLDRDLDVNLRFAAGRLVLYYAEPRELRELGQRVYAQLASSYDDAALTSFRLAKWLQVWMWATRFAKDPNHHDRAMAQARELAVAQREPEVIKELATIELFHATSRGDVAAADRALATVVEVSDPANPFMMSFIDWLRVRIALAKGEGDTALFHASRSRKHAEELAVPKPMLGVRIAAEAQAQLLLGNFDAARALFAETAAMVAGLHAEEMHDMIRMVDAHEARIKGFDDWKDKFATAFAAPRARQFYDSFHTNARFGATMCALALENNIEPEFARRIVELHSLAPPPEAGDAWPWPAKVRTFGGFALNLRGRSAPAHGKTQRKPLELLKALVAVGEAGVDKVRLADMLWPDAEPGTTQPALEMAVSRLRKLLALPDAVRLEDAKVRLDASQVRVDAWAFDRDVDALQDVLHAGTADQTARIRELFERILDTYRGAFLDNEAPQRWMLAARDRWRARFVRSLTDASRHFEARGEWKEVLDLCERGIEADTLAENLYRALMRCHLARGERSEAARVYRRCREMLSVQLGIAPSAETQALFRSIYGE
jgi:DNA-binding SARP family transcriptional activator